MPNVSRTSNLIRLSVAAALGVALPVLAQGPAPTPNPAPVTPTINPPQAPIPQPKRAPLSLRSLRRMYSNGVVSSASTTCTCPLTLIVVGIE